MPPRRRWPRLLDTTPNAAEEVGRSLRPERPWLALALLLASTVVTVAVLAALLHWILRWSLR